MNLEMPRQPLPEPSDGEVCLPDFLAIEPTAWDHTKFQPPTSDHHSRKGPSAGFSAYNTALTTIRWRRSPNDSSRLQSNARILRWSDGSTTLQLASLPQVQYEIDGNLLAPPQRNPVKPTPVSIQAPNNKGGRQGDGTIAGERYDSSKDAFTYLGVPSETTGTVRITNKITAGLSIRQTANEGDEAIEKLQAAMAAAANAVKVEGGNGKLQLIDEDPDMKRAEAERAMREKQRADRKKEAAVQREMDKTNRALGRHGLSSGRYGGLNSSFLEDEELGGGSRPKKGAGARRPKQRRNSIYSDDEDFGRRHFTSKEDEYDEEDDFVARSSEEEVVADDDDDDDGIVEEPRHLERTPKRDRSPPAADEDADADGEVDEDVAPAAARKRQRVIVDDDEE
ncbi:hypothetical protein EJ03DRAFT_344216 [Teratosphaeria nubilosa]|uniref:Leo1-domain-containing protein n=1 Tax=Teratosphaeria nubilosa TaxID=161662 RepID=A0A6G1L5Z3_9PEZI|nr:hypothetical protein EJ03DRAFT_344216 [Teratosphaeria nubilosa]